ncbi:hypothetical protein MUP65_00460 [Patescibacteria group bacterium]|nr:hypothetical protein [Patescibacteria group bacterium]
MKSSWLVMLMAIVVAVLALTFFVGEARAQVAPELTFELAQQICQKILAEVPNAALGYREGIWILELPFDQVLVKAWLGKELYSQISFLTGQLNWEALSGAFDFLGGIVTEYRPQVGSEPESLRVELRGELDPTQHRNDLPSFRSTPQPPSGGSPAGGGSGLSPKVGGDAALLWIVLTGMAALFATGGRKLAGARARS